MATYAKEEKYAKILEKVIINPEGTPPTMGRPALCVRKHNTQQQSKVVRGPVMDTAFSKR